MIGRKDRSSLKWWFFYVVHNCIAHPLLVVGEVIDTIGFFLITHFPWLVRKLPWAFTVFRELTSIIDAFHDKTIADGDTKNLIKQLRQ